MGQVELAELLARHDARVTELLQANNEMLERARAAERRAYAAESALVACARVAGEVAKLIS